MEKWINVFGGMIPKDNYIIEMNWGKQVGIKLLGNKYNVKIERLKKCRYKNTIYKIINGEFKRYIQHKMGVASEIYDYKNYILIAGSYIIEIVGDCPEITVL